MGKFEVKFITKEVSGYECPICKKLFQQEYSAKNCMDYHLVNMSENELSKLL